MEKYISMSNIITLSNLPNAILVVLPEEAKEPFVAKTYVDEDGHTYDTDPQWLEWSGTFPNNTLDLPPGNWRIIGMLGEVTEMDVIPLVDKERFIADGPDLGFRNYNGGKYDWFGTALESLESAILAEGFTFQNNLRNPDDVCYFSRDRMIADVREYHEVQSRVLDRSRCLLLRREI